MGTYAMTGGATGIGEAIKNQLRDNANEVIVVRAPANRRFSVGEKVSLKLDMELASLFDQASELRL